MKNLTVNSFYRFVEISNKKQIKKNLEFILKIKIG